MDRFHVERFGAIGIMNTSQVHLTSQEERKFQNVASMLYHNCKRNHLISNGNIKGATEMASRIGKKVRTIIRLAYTRIDRRTRRICFSIGSLIKSLKGL